MWKKLIGYLKPEQSRKSEQSKEKAKGKAKEKAGTKADAGHNVRSHAQSEVKSESKSEAELLKDLAGTNKAKQAVAIEELGHLRVEAALPQFVEALASSDLAVVMAGVQALHNFHPKLVLPLVLPTLDNPTMWPPARVREVVVGYGTVAVPSICTAFEKAAPEAKPHLLEMLGELATGAELNLIRAALQGEQRLAAARAVMDCAGRVEAAQQLFEEPLKALLQDPLPQVRAQALEALYRLEVPGTGELLAKALLDEDRLVRTRAADLYNEKQEIPREIWQVIGKKQLGEQDRQLIENLLKI